MSHSRVLTSIFLLTTEELLDLVADFTLGDLDIVFGGAIFGHQGEETVFGDVKLDKC